MVEYLDGSVLAQTGLTRHAHTDRLTAWAWPRRLTSGVAFLDFTQVAKLEFQAPDFTRFPCLELAFAALAAGGTAPAILNAANEIAVQAFLDRKIRFTDIAAVVQYALEQVNNRAATSLAVILDADTQARATANDWIADVGGRL
jgi:1-deoxy-D-xylulose-5-phosphate reductoisomerase